MVATELVIAAHHVVRGEVSKGGCCVRSPELLQSADVTREYGEGVFMESQTDLGP